MKPLFTVEKYTLEDLRGIAEIEKECFEKPWSYESFCMEYADKNKIPYVDYFSALVSADGKEMNPDYATDYPAIHPNAKGYEIMEGLLLPVIKKMR